MIETNQKVIVRFPPSPTGLLQMGNVRTLLYNYLFARQNKGTFLLRIEDTDKERSKKEYEDAIFESLEWLGLNYDNGSKEKVWRSSDRTEVYKQKIQELLKSGSAYISEETEGENKQVVRFRNPGGKIKFQDLVRGEIEIDVSDLGDFIIARNTEDPLYHLAVCVDDNDSGITHIIRGDDHISNTPRQILIIEALGGKRPIYAHLPMVLAEDKTKLSKRKHGESVSLKYYRDRGYQKEAIINFLALIGWNPGTEQEVFTLEELVESFDITKIQRKGGIFNLQKLDWINREHILRIPREEQLEYFAKELAKSKFANNKKLEDRDFINKLFNIFIERIHRWGEVGESIDSLEYDYLFEEPILEPEKIIWKKSSKEKTIEALENVNKIIESEQTDKINEKVKEYAEKEGRGEVLWPLRYSLSGKEKSPDPFALLDILGKSESINRINKALETLSRP